MSGGTLFTGGHYLRGDIIHSDNGKKHAGRGNFGCNFGPRGLVHSTRQNVAMSRKGFQQLKSDDDWDDDSRESHLVTVRKKWTRKRYNVLIWINKLLPSHLSANESYHSGSSFARRESAAGAG